MIANHALLGPVFCIVVFRIGMGCGARTDIEDFAQARVNDAQTPQTHSAHDASSSVPNSTLFIESDTPTVLLPQPCQRSDAASDYPKQLSMPPTALPTSEASAECGNSRHQEHESCDDGNHSDGDGCNRFCQIEPFYICETGGQKCVRLTVCGDGVVATREECDDGNWVPQDGCSPSCQVEQSCSASTSNCLNCTESNKPPCAWTDDQGFCGDGIVQATLGELCDYGNSNTNAYGGCTEVCTLAARCGDLVVQTCGNETCDDGNRVGGDGCDANCAREQLWVR